MAGGMSTGGPRCRERTAEEGPRAWMVSGTEGGGGARASQELASAPVLSSRPLARPFPFQTQVS